MQPGIDRILYQKRFRLLFLKLFQCYFYISFMFSSDFDFNRHDTERSTDSSNDELSQNGMKIVAQICIFDSRVSIFYWRSEHGRMSAAYHGESDMLLYTFEHRDNRSIVRIKSKCSRFFDSHSKCFARL